jgi:hypothetical protein
MSRPRDGRHRLPVRPHGRRPPGPRRRPCSAWSCPRSPIPRQPHRFHYVRAGRQRRAAAVRDHLERRRRPRSKSLRGAPRPLVSHATGQRVALAHRIAAIRTEVAGEPVRTTTLTYARSIEAPEQPPHRHRHRRRGRGRAADLAHDVHRRGRDAHGARRPRRRARPRSHRGGPRLGRRGRRRAPRSPRRRARRLALPQKHRRHALAATWTSSRRPPPRSADDALRRPHRRRRARPARAAGPRASCGVFSAAARPPLIVAEPIALDSASISPIPASRSPT